MEPWIAPLERGDPEAAWDRFVHRYRRLVFAAIRQYASDQDEVMDCFAWVCEAFRANDFGRLRRCAARFDPGRPFSTLLVVIVRNLSIDWFRHRRGRRRLGAPVRQLPPLQQRIFEWVILAQRSHAEAYEVLRPGPGAGLSFGEFLREVAATYRAVGNGNAARVLPELAGPPPVPESESHLEDPAVLEEQRRLLAGALEVLSPDDRLAVQLYVVDGLPAAQIAQALGYPHAKTVYNHVYRALTAIRSQLERAGIRAGDL